MRTLVITLAVSLGQVHAAQITATFFSMTSDGETITVRVGSKFQRVRLWGIAGQDPGQKDFRGRARKHAASLGLTRGSTIKITPMGTVKKTLVGNAVLPNGKSLSEELIRAGYAWWDRDTEPNNADLEKIETSAKQVKAGLWAQPKIRSPWQFRAKKAADAKIDAQFEARERQIDAEIQRRRARIVARYPNMTTPQLAKIWAITRSLRGRRIKLSTYLQMPPEDRWLYTIAGAAPKTP